MYHLVFSYSEEGKGWVATLLTTEGTDPSTMKQLAQMIAHESDSDTTTPLQRIFEDVRAVVGDA